MMLRNPSKITDKIATFLFKKGIIKELYTIFDQPLKIGERGFIGTFAVVFLGIMLIQLSSANTVEGHIYVTVMSAPPMVTLIDPQNDFSAGITQLEFICQGGKLQGDNVDNMTFFIYNSTGSLIYTETDDTNSNEICESNDGIMDYNYSCLNYSFTFTPPYEDNFVWTCEACDDYVGEFDANGHCTTADSHQLIMIKQNMSIFPASNEPFILERQNNNFGDIKEVPSINLNQSKNFTPSVFIKLNTFLPLMR